MSEMFYVKDEKVQLPPANNGAQERDVLRGFKGALRLGQPLRALEYLTHVIDIMVNEIQQLKSDLAEANKDVAPVVEKPVAKKSPKEQVVAVEE